MRTVHTPGPWRVHTEPGQKNTPTLTGACHYDSDYVAVVAADGTVVADNAHYYAHGLDPDNAPLVAEAPTMLDLLVRAADAIEALDGTSVENEKLVDDFRAWRARCEPQPTDPTAKVA